MLADADLKKDKGKPRYSLIPPNALEGVAMVLTFGAEKYEPNSWQRIEEVERYLDALMRHTEAIRKGEIIDPESGELHTAHISANAMFLHEFFLIERTPIDILEYLKDYNAKSDEP